MLIEFLNSEQREIVEYENNSLVIACPGSGKTRTLVAKLIYEGAKLKKNEKIAAITYTNLAADEIGLRVNENCFDDSFYWGGTIHSLCTNWILKPFSLFIDELRFGYKLIDEDDAMEILDEIKQKHNFRENVNTRRGADGNFVEITTGSEGVLKEYDNRLKEAKLIDFDLVLFYSFKILLERKSVARNLSQIFKWILVDEYQDTQELQYLIIGEIIKARNNHTKILFVGDPNQGIYNTLGGVAKTKHELESSIGGYNIEEKSLNGNYRTTQEIIDKYRDFQLFGENIIARGSNKNNPSEISFRSDISVESLPEHILKVIMEIHNKRVPYSEIAVIAPRWFDLINVARRIKQIEPDVPLNAMGLSPLCRDDNNIFFHLSRLLLSSPSPDQILVRLKWAQILFDLLVERLPNSFESSFNNKSILKVINSFKSNNQVGIEFLKEGFNFFGSKIGVDFSTSLVFKDSLEEFERKCLKKQARNGTGDSISVYKSGFAKAGGVSFISTYKCKGLEYHSVIAFGMLWGYLPHWNEIFSSNIDENEVSKKLLYVISSRAKNNLYMIAESGRRTTRGTPLFPNRHLVEVFSERSV
ncbi:hypothetical protein VN24_02900 [Paenibacillus beijingensis]|uniref:DNA 3'-5' helicase n=1 Tax=Paenibacillus beijingensis TaxID=1126833 RepID=A0A0D5NQ59_9BACL|nr:hypothetical protein VN24_02900 [Paenibacillus beijingensis]